MQSKESELTTEISKCNGCIRKEEETEGNCQQWIRVNSKINVVSDIWIEKSNNKIKVTMNQITEKTEINNLENKEWKLKNCIIIEDLEVEIIKRQRLEEDVNQEIIRTLKNNLRRNKNKYTIYTDGVLNIEIEGKRPNKLWV